MNGQDTLSAALEGFIREHEYCGELDTGLENDRVWMACTFGARIVRMLEPIPPPRCSLRLIAAFSSTLPQT
jgi:hypothetical protein